jgi:spermidine synthase
VLGISVKVLLSLVVGTIAVLLSAQPLRFGIAIAGIAVIGWISQRTDEVLHRDRSFYGAYEVRRAAGGAHFLVHGTTIHGAQYTDSARHLRPVTYYHTNGPVGQLFRGFQDSIPHRRIGVVGLGAGTLLCYSKPGEEWTFFEIDPVVERISRNPKYFTYLRDCQVRPKIVFGDARLTLAREPSKKFGLLIIDAFSSDAIPIHMLTREAFALYRRVLDDDGILLVHISNQHLDLKPVVAELSDDAGLTALIGEHDATRSEESRTLDYSSDWVGLTRRPDALRSLAKDDDWHPLVARAGDRPWTDDYSNVFSVIRW